jgi:branched-chain amino acid aminotransferase
MKPTKWIWKNGEFVAWENATTHVLTHGLHYGTGVFEGVRAYKTPKGSAIFRSNEHYQRLQNSAKIIQMPAPYSKETMIEATKELLRKNELTSCYIRPIYYFGYGEMGLNPEPNPVDAVIAAWEWGTYLGEEGLEKGIRCKVSSWTRVDSRIIPAGAKSTANYLNSALAKREALECGYDEAILLNMNGTIAEGPGENIFLITDGKIITTPQSDNALNGITCQSIISIAKNMGIEITYASIAREQLYTADELFFTGTAAEVTPIREVDNRVIGNGKRGPITHQLQDQFFKIVKGEDSSYASWLDHI